MCNWHHFAQAYAPKTSILHKKRLFLHEERRTCMYETPRAELLYPETEAVLSDLLGASKEDNDNGFNITDLLS